MCLNPLFIRNPTKVICTDGGHKLRIQVPCGHCALCKQAKRNEWYVRTFYEMQRTFSNGGYVYFDTLTYNDANLPKLSHFLDIEKYGLRDFSCFNLEHYKSFIKRLRRRLHYNYGVEKDAFRYFLASEYGEDDRYTHRPHYHVLFFIYADVDPLEFSQLVSDCWYYGRTDGFPFKPANYVYEHVYGRSICGKDNTDFPIVSSLCLYVSKYITKNSTFVKKLDARIGKLRQCLTVYDKLNCGHVTEECQNTIDSLKRTIDMFHRQSHGFGLSYLDKLTSEKLMFLHYDKVIMRDSDKINKTYPLPLYYKRKLYYDLKKHSDGTYYWQINEKGLEHYKTCIPHHVDSTCIRYMDIINNCSNRQLIDEFFNLLGKRDISDFVIYELFYKGRHRHSDSINYELKTQKPLNDEESNLHDWLLYCCRSMQPYATHNKSISVNENLLREPILTQKEITNKYEKIKDYSHGSYMISNSRASFVDEYISCYTFNEHSDPIFANFDKLCVVLRHMMSEQNEHVQITFDYLEELKNKYKMLNLL